MNVINYSLDSIQSNLSKITLNAQYPERGYAFNTESEMVVYILKGEAVLYYEGTENNLVEGSVFLIKKDQQYFWEPHKEVTLLIFSTPPWTHEQQRVV